MTTYEIRMAGGEVNLSLLNGKRGSLTALRAWLYRRMREIGAKPYGVQCNDGLYVYDSRSDANRDQTGALARAVICIAECRRCERSIDRCACDVAS